MLIAGLIGVSNNKKGLFPTLIRFFTKSKYTHCFLTFGSLYGCDSVIEASQIVQVVQFKSHYIKDINEEYLLFQPYVVEANIISEALGKCFQEYAGVEYGYIQLLYFVYRWFMGLVFKKDVRRQKNWLTSGVICSELVYNYLYQLGSPYQELLTEYSSETIQTQDILELIQNNPHLFKEVYATDQTI